MTQNDTPTVEKVTEDLAKVNVTTEGGQEAQQPSKKAAEKKAKKEKPAPPPAPVVEDHAKDRYGVLPVNFSRIQHGGIEID